MAPCLHASASWCMLANIIASNAPINKESAPEGAFTVVEVAGVEPASLVLSYVASTCLAFNLLSSPDRLNASYLVSRLPKYN